LRGVTANVPWPTGLVYGAAQGLPFRLHPAHNVVIAASNSRDRQIAVRRINPIDKHVGARVRTRRIMLNKSQAEVANALGLTFQQLQKYENGANRISASRLQSLCAILQAPVSFFFDGLPDVPETDGDAAALNGFLATSDGIALMTGYARIRAPKLRRAIVALVEQIVAEREGTVH
jgi:transcriptional regulator with XRE-family HTH domain